MPIDLIVIWIMQISTLTIACFLCSICERRVSVVTISLILLGFINLLSCSLKDRELRSYFRTCLKDRRNLPLMRCMHRISMQLWQEAVTFVAGNFVTINIGTLGKVSDFIIKRKIGIACHVYYALN